MAQVAFSFENLTEDHRTIAKEFFQSRNINSDLLSGAPVTNDWFTPVIGDECIFVAGNDAMEVTINKEVTKMPVSLVIFKGAMKLVSGRHSLPTDIKSGDKVKADSFTQKYSDRAKKMQDCFKFTKA